MFLYKLNVTHTHTRTHGRTHTCSHARTHGHTNYYLYIFIEENNIIYAINKSF